MASIYNPDLLTKQQLIGSFVVRIKKFEKLFADIKSSTMQHPEQPILVVGLRGMGKTTLLLRLSYEVENDPELNKWLIPIVFNEEEYGVNRLFKFWETIAEYLEKRDSAFAGLYDQMDSQYALLNNESKYEEEAFSLLETTLKQKQKKLLLFIDNFGDMFQRFTKKERQRLREVLTTCPDLRIIAGSSVAAESFFKYDDPFYELFKIERLEGLTKEEAEALLLQLGESYPENPVREILEKQPERVETLRRITGGIPRTIVLLFEIFVDDKDGNAFTDLESILDRVTPLYKHRMDELPSQQQEIMNAIALHWDAVSAKEIAQKTRLGSKQVSAQLKQLHLNNLIDIQPTKTKNHLYLLHDRFFNIWYLMRMARRGDKNKVLWLIRFLEEWCDEEQLSKRARTLMTAFGRGEYHPKGGLIFSTALYYAEKHNLETRYELTKQTERFLQDRDPSLHEQLNQSDMAFFGRALKSLKGKDVENALRELQAMKEKEAQDYLLLSALCRHQGDADQAERHYAKAVEMHAEHPERIMGNIFRDYLHDYKTAEEYYRKAIDSGDAKALRKMGWMYENKLNKPGEAEQFYREAIAQGDTLAWDDLGDLYRLKYKNNKKAEEFYKMAIEAGHFIGWRSLGYLYRFNYKNYSKAEEFYRIAIDKGETLAWDDLGDLYRFEFRDFENAEAYYRKAIEEGHLIAWRSLGYIYQYNLKNYEKAEELYRFAIDKGETLAWDDLGDLYRLVLRDFNNAEVYYRNAIAEGHWTAWRSLGYLNQYDFKNFSEAEKIYQTAIDNGETMAWIDYGNLYQIELKNPDKAETCYHKAIEEGLNLGFRSLGHLYHYKLNNYGKSEEYYRSAIEKGETLAWDHLGDLYRFEHKDYKKAEEYYRKAIDEGHNTAWRSLGLLYHYNFKIFTEAEKFYRAAIERGESLTWDDLGDLYRFEYKDYKKAEEYYRKAIDEGHFSAYRSLGHLYRYNIKDYKNAEAFYRKAIEQGQSSAWIDLGYLYRHEHKRVLDAAEFFQKAIEENHNEAWDDLGILYEYDLKDYKKAEECFLKSVENGDNSGFNSLAWLFFIQKTKADEALEYAQKGRKELPDHKNLAHTYACVLLWNNLIDDALKVSEEFIYDPDYFTDSEEFLLLPFLLLAKSQYDFLYDYFTSEKGQELQLKDRFKPLWYALLHYLQDKYPTEYLRMPPEIRETVEEIIAKVEQMRIDYALPKSSE